MEEKAQKLLLVSEMKDSSQVLLLKHIDLVEKKALSKIETLEKKLDYKIEEVKSEFPTFNDFLEVIEKPKDGEQGIQGEKGDKGDKGETGLGIDGKDGANGANGSDGKNGINGTDGKDGSPDTPEQIVEKINISPILINLEKVKGLSELERLSKLNAFNPTMGPSFADLANVNKRIDGISSSSQSPWTSNINAGGFNLLNLGQTASTIASFDASKNLVSLSTSTYPSLTELSYVKGVTSSIQTQLNAKFTLPSLTAGSVLFSDGSTIAQNNSNFFWDNSNKRLGIGGNNPATALSVMGTNANPSVIAEFSHGVFGLGQYGMRILGLESVHGEYSFYGLNAGSQGSAMLTMQRDTNWILIPNGYLFAEQGIVIGGTTAPANPGYLQVNNGAGVGILIKNQNTGAFYSSGVDTGGTYFESKGTGTGDDKIRYQTSKSGDLTNYTQFKVDAQNGILFTKLGTGNANVGILNTTPSDLLDIGIAGNTQGVIRLEGATSGYVRILTATNAGSWNFSFPPNTGSSGQYLKTDGAGVSTWSSAGAIVASGDLTGQTATVVSITAFTTPNDGNAHTYIVGGYLTVTALSAGSVTLSCTYTDETNNGQTATFFGEGLTTAAISTVNAQGFPPITIRTNPNSLITLTAVFFGASITFDTGGFIQNIN